MFGFSNSLCVSTTLVVTNLFDFFKFALIHLSTKASKISLMEKIDKEKQLNSTEI